MFEEFLFLLFALSTHFMGVRGILFKRLISLDNTNLENDILDSFPNNGSIPDCSRLCLWTAGCEYFRIYSGICTLFNTHPLRNGTQSGTIFFIKYEGSCPTSQGYTFESSIPLCFKLSDTKKRWKKAQQLCQESGSQLLVLNTEKRHTFMLNFLQDVNVDTFWVGLRQANIGTYAWYDGSTFTYKWDQNEPDHLKRCGVITTSHLRSKFCYKWSQFICEVRLFA